MAYDLECQLTIVASSNPAAEDRLLEAIWAFEEFLKANGIGFVLDLRDSDTRCRILHSVHSTSGFERRIIVGKH